MLFHRIEAEDAILTIILKEDFKDIRRSKHCAKLNRRWKILWMNISQAEISLTAPTSSSRFAAEEAEVADRVQKILAGFMGIGSNQERIVIKG